MKTPDGNTRLFLHTNTYMDMYNLTVWEVGSGKREVDTVERKWHGKWEVKTPGEMKVPIQLSVSGGP